MNTPEQRPSQLVQPVFGSKDRPINWKAWNQIEKEGCLLTPNSLTRFFPEYQNFVPLGTSETVTHFPENSPTYETPFVISLNGPSGGGKDTVLKIIRGLHRSSRIPEGIHVPDFVFESGHAIRIIRTTTSRPPRDDDHFSIAKDGRIQSKNYTFVTHEEFMKLVDEGKLAEWMKEESGFYGTSKRAFQKIPRGTSILVWRGNIEGLRTFKGLIEKPQSSEPLPPFVGIFISPEKTLAEYRTHVMANRTPEEAEKRWNTVLWEMENAPKPEFGISYFVINRFSDSSGIPHMVNDVLAIMDRSIRR